MSLISDSDAVLDSGRIYSQHLAALTLLNNKLQDPNVSNLRWLDLACGQGQIISQLLGNLSNENRQKLSYVGFDIHVGHTKVAEELASKLSLNDYSFHQGYLTKFSGIIDSPKDFDFITFTSAAHEVSPHDFYQIILDAVMRLSPDGELYIYDMESLVEPELGALPWKKEEISILFDTIFNILDPKFKVHPSTWGHTNCKGWTAVIQRRHIEPNNEKIDSMRGAVITALTAVVDKILSERLKDCDDALEAYCRFGAETANNEQDKLSCLYKFWALHRAIGAKK
jgi:SAM-dependent methyltransferase